MVFNRVVRAALGGQFVDWFEFWNRERSDADWLLDPILARGRGHVLDAAEKTGKSLVLLWAAASIATGVEPVVVFYLDYEMSDDDVFERLTDMGYGPHSDLSRLRYALLPTLPPLDRKEGADALLGLLDAEQAIRPHQHVVVIIDTTSRAVEGDENSADTIRAFYRHTGIALKQRGVTWARLDHAGKDATRGQRGSSAKGDDVDLVWRMEATDNGLVLKRDAARMGWVPERVPLERRDNPLRYEVAKAAWPAGTRELAALLDDLGVPGDAGNRAARQALHDTGHQASSAVLRAAVKYRKSGSARGSARAIRPTRHATRHTTDNPQKQGAAHPTARLGTRSSPKRVVAVTLGTAHPRTTTPRSTSL